MRGPGGLEKLPRGPSGLGHFEGVRLGYLGKVRLPR